MLPFETVKTASSPLSEGAGRSGALRPHSRALPSRAAGLTNTNSPTRSQPQGRLAATVSPQRSTGAAVAATTGIFSPSNNINKQLSATTGTGASSSSLTSPLKPGSAAVRAARRANSPSGTTTTVGRRLHTDIPSSHHQQQHQRQDAGPVLASEVVPDFQLCVNYKKVDITVNDAKKHLRVRPPRIKAAVSEVSCAVTDCFEYPQLFSVDCGLDDVGVDHSVLFFVVAQNPECFAVAPTVDCEGTLRFQAAPPAPGSVHLDGTTLLVTAWDALSLAGSSITHHADTVEELEEGVPFCSPIKLTVKLIGGGSSSSGNAAASTNSPLRSTSPTHNNTNNSTIMNSSSILNNSSKRGGVITTTQADSSSAVAAEVVRFPRLNPNMLRDPFLVLGAQLQSRLVNAAPCPLTDTEIALLPMVHNLFLTKHATNGATSELTVQLQEGLDEQALRAEVQKHSSSNSNSNNSDAQLCAALESLVRYNLENGSSLGEGTVVEVAERLVTLRRQMWQESQTSNTKNSDKTSRAVLDLLRAFNALAAAEVAVGSLADASATLDRAFALSNDNAPIVDDTDAAWIMLRRCYVSLVRGEAEAALRMLRNPAIAEIDAVFADNSDLRVVFHVLGACARCALGRYGEAIRRLRQVIAASSTNSNNNESSTANTTTDNTGRSRDNTTSNSNAASSPTAVQLPSIPLNHALALACIRAGDVQQARQVLGRVKQEQQQRQDEADSGSTQNENNTTNDTVVELGVTCLLANMSNLYSALPAEIGSQLRSNSSYTATSSSSILRSAALMVRVVDAWQALSLDPHSTAARELLTARVASTNTSGDLCHVKLRALDAAVTVATSAAAVSGNVDRQRRAADHSLLRLQRELASHHRDVAGCAEVYGWLELASIGNESAAAITTASTTAESNNEQQHQQQKLQLPTTTSTTTPIDTNATAAAAQRALTVAERVLRDIQSFGVDVNEQCPRLAQLACHACGVLNVDTVPAVVDTATTEALDETVMRFGDGTRALFTPLVDRAVAEINSNKFAPALEKLHKALKIVDSGNAIFLLGPLFRPAAQLSSEELTERSRLSKGRVDSRAAGDFAVVLCAMAAVAEAEGRLFDAETLLLQVLAALELAGVEESISTAAVYRAMSQLLFEDGHFGDALAYCERAERLLHAKFPYAGKLRAETRATQQFIEFQLRSAGYSLKRVPDTRFKFAVFV